MLCTLFSYRPRSRRSARLFSVSLFPVRQKFDIEAQGTHFLDQNVKRFRNSGFKGIVAGDYDELPEQAFYMVGAIEEAAEKAKTM